MIDRTEILAAAAELSLAADVVEKDYVLGWLLAGIYARDANGIRGGSRSDSATPSGIAARGWRAARAGRPEPG